MIILLITICIWGVALMTILLMKNPNPASIIVVFFLSYMFNAIFILLRPRKPFSREKDFDDILADIIEKTKTEDPPTLE